MVDFLKTVGKFRKWALLIDFSLGGAFFMVHPVNKCAASTCIRKIIWSTKLLIVLNLEEATLNQINSLKQTRILEFHTKGKSINKIKKIYP